MSGIMTSSEPLMNEVQKFERGGTVRERAISGEGALDQLASSNRTPMDFRALDRNLGAKVHAAHDAVEGSIFRFLGNTFRVIRDKIFHEESGVEIEEPSLKREILTQGERIAEEDMAMAMPVPQGQPRVFTQPVPETMDPVTTTAPAAPTMEDIIAARSIAENQGGPMEEAAAALAGMTSQDPVNTDQGSNVSFAQLMSPPMYDLSSLVTPNIDDRSGLERLEAELEADPENIKAQVVRLGQSGKRAAEIANALGRPIQEILDVGLGVAADGTVGLGALAADLISVVQGAIVNNPESAEFYAGIAQNLRKFGDESYYGEGDILPRISNTDLLRGDPGLSEAEQLAQQREQIRKDSLAATLDGDDSLFAEGAPVEFLPEGSTAAFPRTTSVTSVEGSMTAPEMAQSDLPEINVTPSPIQTMSGSGLTLPASPQGRVGDMPVDELIDFRSPAAALESEAILRNRAAAAAMENEMDEALDPIVPSNTEGSIATAMGTETQAQTEALDALVADSPLQKDAQNVIDEAARKTDVTPDPSQGDDIAPSDLDDIVREPQGPENTRPRARPPTLEPIVKIANDPDLTPEEKSDKASNQIFTGLTGQEVNLSPKESVKAYEKMFSEMLGMKDKDAEKEMWHNMAMIGFAIAAGESPDALSNIANGLLAGTKMMKQDRASEQARKDKINMLALSEANEDRRLEARLRSAERVAGMRAAGDAVGMRDFKSPIDAIQAAEAQVAKEMDAGTLELKPGETVQSVAINRVTPIYEAMNVDMSNFSSLAGGGTKQLTMQETEAAAKAAGKSEFVFGGQRYPVR